MQFYQWQKNGGEGTSAMGIDTPLVALATDHQPLFNYFKQIICTGYKPADRLYP